MKLLFTEERTTFEGAHYTLRDAIANPKPVQRPYPPFWIGGRGERKTLRVIAQHADVWNAPGGEPDEVARLAGILDAHCADVGRDPAEIRRSVQIRYAGDDDALLRAAGEFVERNVRDLIVVVSPGGARAHAEAVAALVPRLRRGRASRTSRRQSRRTPGHSASRRIGETPVLPAGGPSCSPPRSSSSCSCSCRSSRSGSASTRATAGRARASGSRRPARREQARAGTGR